MNSFRIFNRRAGSVFAVAALVVTTAIPGLVSAATVTERSVALSTSVKSTAASYTVKFKGVAASTGAFAIDFCTDAAIGAVCTAPNGIDTTNVGTSGTATVTPTNSNKGVKVVLASPVTAGNEVSVELTNITNPSAVGVFYARIVTYVDGTTNYHYTAPDDLDDGGNHLDDGGVALSITDGFSVNGAVLETLLFCVDDAAIADGCTGITGTPGLTLGTNGILDTTLSEGTIYSQISTNAAHGAVVNLKSSTAGGGLKRAEAAASDITPLTSAGAISLGAAKFGLKLGTITADTGTIDTDWGYSGSDYFMRYVGNGSSGVTSAYGDTIYDTHDEPISNGNVPLTFGANISPTTPAGSYSASLNLIATGKF